MCVWPETISITGKFSRDLLFNAERNMLSVSSREHNRMCEQTIRANLFTIISSGGYVADEISSQARCGLLRYWFLQSIHIMRLLIASRNNRSKALSFGFQSQLQLSELLSSIFERRQQSKVNARRWKIAMEIVFSIRENPSCRLQDMEIPLYNPKLQKQASVLCHSG